MQQTASSPSGAYWLVLAVPCVLLAAVYVAQFGFGLAPCDLCWWQRYPHFAAIALAGTGMTARGTRLGDAMARLAGLAILVSGLIGGFHAGVEYGWWEGLTSCSSSSLGNDPLAAIMNAPLIRCDVAPWTLLGISLAGFNFLISVATTVLVFVWLGRSNKGVAK